MAPKRRRPGARTCLVEGLLIWMLPCCERLVRHSMPTNKDKDAILFLVCLPV